MMLLYEKIKFGWIILEKSLRAVLVGDDAGV